MLPLEFGESMDWNGARLTAFPASHILGAAQLLIEYRGERLVYTGDIKLRPPLCGDTTQPIACDRLIIESTFGLPIYRLLDREDAIERILRFARACLGRRRDPGVHRVCAGPRPGNRSCALPGRHSAPPCMAPSRNSFPFTRNSGYAFPGWEPYDARATSGKALVVVPTHGNVLEASGKNVRLAYVSGWAALDNARSRSGAEELIPYSDHADFDELLALVAQSGAKHIDVVHGYTAPFAHILRTRGYSAAAPQRAGERTQH